MFHLVCKYSINAYVRYFVRNNMHIVLRMPDYFFLKSLHSATLFILNALLAIGVIFCHVMYSSTG